MFRPLVLIIFIFFFSPLLVRNAFAQNKDKPVLELKFFSFSKEQSTLYEVNEFVYQKLKHLHYGGYLAARCDSIISDRDSISVYLYSGNIFVYHLENNNLSPLIIRKLGLEKYFSPEVFEYPEFEKLTGKILEYYNNNGHPFARLHNTGIEVRQDTIKAKLNIDLMDYIVFDSLVIEGDAEMNHTFLENHSGIKKGSAYNEKAIQTAGLKIQELNFVQMAGPPLVGFSQGKARLTLPLKKIKASRFDGIAGLLSSNDPQRSFQLTGFLNLYLVNALKAGEYFDFSWKGLGHGTQSLSLVGEYPYPFNTPILLNTSFSLHRQDSSWIQIAWKPKISFRAQPQISFGVFANLVQNNSLINRSNNTSIISNPDYNSSLYGIDFTWKNPGFERVLLQAGQMINISIAAGNKTIDGNNSLQEPSMADSDLKTFQLNYELKGEKRWRLSDNITLNLQANNAVFAGKNMFENQLYRLGGFRSLRGFDEESLIASSFAFANLEFRLFTSENTFFSTFFNGGWFERKANDNYYADFPIGIGTGLNLETQAGIFGIYVALGKQKNTRLELRNSKIHIGYTSVF